MASGRISNPDNLIFPTRAGGFIDPSDLRKQWKKMLAALGIPHRRMYDTRHTHITHMLDHGVPLPVVQKRAGHSDPRITQRVYAHVQAGKEEKHVAEAENTLLYGDAGQAPPITGERTGRKAKMFAAFCPACDGDSTFLQVGALDVCAECGSEYARAEDHRGLRVA